MTAEELLDFHSMVQIVAEALELKHDGTAASIVIQVWIHLCLLYFKQ